MITGTRYRLSAEIQRQGRLASDMARAQSDISTGTRLQAASDDALASARVSEIARMQAGSAVYKTNIDAAASQASQADSVLTSVATSLTRARDLMLQGSSGTMNATDRAAIVTELRGIVTDLQNYQTQKDSRGQALFPDTVLQVPLSADVKVAPTSARAAVFDNIETDSGPLDLTAIVSNAADALEIGVDADRQTASTAALADLNAAIGHMAGVQADQGVRAARIDALGDQLSTLSSAQAIERSGLEDTDVSAAVTRISSLKLSLDAAQAVFAKINKSTLFDLLS